MFTELFQSFLHFGMQRIAPPCPLHFWNVCNGSTLFFSDVDQSRRCLGSRPCLSSVPSVDLTHCTLREECILPRARFLGWRRRRCYLPWHCPHGKRKGRRRRDTRSQNEEATRNKRSTTHHGWHEYGVTRASRHMSEYAHNQTRAMRMRKMTCEVYLSTPRRLQWIAIDCKRNQLQQKEVT